MIYNKLNLKGLSKITSIILVFFLFLIGFSFYYFYLFDETGDNSLIKNKSPQDCFFRRKIDGLCVNSKEETNPWPVALMIDNHPDSWPQYGLSAAPLVYSTLVEGGNTRLMAVYAGDEAEKIGPIRSARPYYVSWAKEINALYGHSGGSTEAIEKIREYQVLNLEEATSYGPFYIWRDRTGEFFAPHNLLSSTEKIEKALVDFNLATSTSSYQAWQFDEHASSTVDRALEIKIDYSAGSLFDIEYKYNTTTAMYLRYQNNEAFIDRLTGEQFGIKNVIIQFVPAEIHLDAEDRLRIETLGQGKAWIFYDGKISQGRWIRNKVNERTKYFDEFGQEMIFKPGNTWIEVVPGEREVIFN